jgi:uncharacterized membrane protein YdbT with pleckstrin-like domain
MAACPHCEAPLGEPLPALCPSCGTSLGEPPRRKAAPVPAAEPEVVLFEGTPAPIASVLELVLTVLTLGLALLYLVPKARSTRYRLTNHRVVVEYGLVDKRMEQVDLFRVVDFVVELPLGQRLLGTGNLLLECQDRTTKEVRIDRIRTDVRALYEAMRKAAQAERDRRGVRTLDPL